MTRNAPRHNGAGFAFGPLPGPGRPWEDRGVQRTRILIVDDDEGMLDSLVMALEAEFDVVTAVNGRDALDVMAHGGIDVVLLDLMMPVLDGEGYMREHVQRHPGVPVLLLSADMNLRTRAADLGVHDHLHKPFSLAALEAKLRKLAARGGPAPASAGGPGGGAPPPGGGPSGAQARARQFTTMSLMGWTFSPAG